MAAKKRAVFVVLTAAFIFVVLQGGAVHSVAKESNSSTNKTILLTNHKKVKEILYSQLKEWRHVPHRTGGLSKKGIDCSGFVHLTFLKRMGIEVPRSTKLLATFGTKISPRKLRPGDLVFFKTGFKVRHVGIYVEDRKFVHVSKKKGVMLSSLDDYYWSKVYWKAIRLDV